MSGPGSGKKKLPSISGKERKLDPGSTWKQQEQDCKQGDSMGIDAHPRHRTPGRTTTKYYNTAQESGQSLRRIFGLMSGRFMGGGEVGQSN